MAGHLMVVGGHISDPENMAGAVMLKHKKAGWDITIVPATTGEKGHPTLSAEDYLKMRLADAHASAEFIGANLELMPYADGELPVNDESVWVMADLIRKHRPNLIITHWKGSFHIDHNNTHDIVHQALFRAGLPAFEREHRGTLAPSPCSIRKTGKIWKATMPISISMSAMSSTIISPC